MCAAKFPRDGCKQIIRGIGTSASRSIYTEYTSWHCQQSTISNSSFNRFRVAYAGLRSFFAIEDALARKAPLRA